MSALEAALALAARGLKVVWIRPREKRPLFDRWVERATSDAADLTAQAREVPATAGVGIALGYQADGRYLLAIDVDDAERWTELTAQYGQPPPTLAISSARGDKLLYRVSESASVLSQLRNVTGLGKRPGVDIKVAGGQIVAPPSIHPSGTQYTWHTDLPIAVLPAPWLTAILPAVRLVPPAPLVTPRDSLTRARAYVAAMPASVAGQGGHDAAWAVAVKLVHGFGLDDADAWDIFTEYNRKCTPPWSHQELLHKLKSARLDARHTAPVLDRPRADAPPPSASKSEPEPLRIEFLDHDELYAPDPPADLLVPGLGICAGPCTGYFGQSFVGKSICTMALGLAVSLGLDLWGKWPVRRGPWVHLDYEQGRRRTKKIVQRLTAGLGLTLEDTRGHLRAAIYPPVNLTTKDAVDHYARAFDGCAVATLDALRGLTPGIDENSSEIRDYMGVLRLASEKTGCVPLLNHNAGKPPPVGQRARKHEGRGSSGIFDECQTVLVATGSKGEPSLVTHEKDRELGRTVEDFFLRIFDVEVDGDPMGGIGVLVYEAQAAPTASKATLRQQESEARRKAQEEAKAAQREVRSRETVESRRRRDESDDATATALRAERPGDSHRVLAAELERRLACGHERARNALLRTCRSA